MAALCEEPVKLASRGKNSSERRDKAKRLSARRIREEGSGWEGVRVSESEREREKREQGSQAVLEFCQSLVWSVCSRIQEAKHAKKGHKYYQSIINQQAGFSRQTPCNFITKTICLKKV